MDLPAVRKGGPVTTKRCAEPPKGCGLERDIEEFRIEGNRSRDDTRVPRRAKVCKICEITLRLAAKALDPYTSAFKQRRRSHASRWGYSVADLVDVYGWDDVRRIGEMRAQFEFGYCPVCVWDNHGVCVLEYFRDMTHGLADLTIDRIRQDEPPWWPNNVRWICKTCNSREGRRPKAEHAAVVQAEHQLRLFEATPQTYTQEVMF